MPKEELPPGAVQILEATLTQCDSIDSALCLLRAACAPGLMSRALLLTAVKAIAAAKMTVSEILAAQGITPDDS